MKRAAKVFDTTALWTGVYAAVDAGGAGQKGHFERLPPAAERCSCRIPGEAARSADKAALPGRRLCPAFCRGGRGRAVRRGDCFYPRGHFSEGFPGFKQACLPQGHAPRHKKEHYALLPSSPACPFPRARVIFLRVMAAGTFFIAQTGTMIRKSSRPVPDTGANGEKYGTEQESFAQR